MATFTLDKFEAEGLEEQVQRKTNLPWKVVSSHCFGPDFIPIISFAYEMEIGPEDQEFRGKIRVQAQSDAHNGITNLYGFCIEGDAVEALQILDMMHQSTTTFNNGENS